MAGSCEPTTILDWQAVEIAHLATRIDSADGAREFLATAHREIARSIVPVYGMEDRQAASTTVRLGRGSCSQRLAVLEAVARRSGVKTRVRGIVVDGSFWYPRFPHMKALVPNRVILAWPEFWFDGAWLPVGELFGSLDTMAACGVGFSNAGGETIFDAIGTTALDWDGTTGVAACDLSASVREDLGHFDSRDELFAAYGQTLCWPARTAANRIFGRRSP